VISQRNHFYIVLALDLQHRSAAPFVQLGSVSANIAVPIILRRSKVCKTQLSRQGRLRFLIPSLQTGYD
jgi:hypothetical protein